MQRIFEFTVHETDVDHNKFTINRLEPFFRRSILLFHGIYVVDKKTEEWITHGITWIWGLLASKRIK